MRLSIWLLALMVGLHAAVARPADAGDQDHWKIGEYSLLLSKGDPEGGLKATLTVERGGLVLKRISDVSLWVNPTRAFVKLGAGATSADAERPFKMGSDVLGLGVPTVVIEGFDGGPHCCYALTILMLGERLRVLPMLDLLDAGGVHFRKAGGRDALIMSMRDYTFAYWRASFAGSSAPEVLLSFDAKAGRYVADAALMRAPLPPADEVLTWRSQARAADEEKIAEGSKNVPAEITQRVLDMIYAGHLAAAHAFLTGAWAGSPAGRDAYWADLTTCQLRLSQFWPTVARMNGLPAARPLGKCRRFGLSHE